MLVIDEIVWTCFSALIFPPVIMSEREKIEIYLKWQPTVIVALLFSAQVRILPSMSSSAILVNGPDQTSTLFSKLFKRMSPPRTVIYFMVVLCTALLDLKTPSSYLFT